MPDPTHHYGPDPTSGGNALHRGAREDCPGPSCGPTVPDLPEIPEAAISAVQKILGSPRGIGGLYEEEIREILAAATPHIIAAYVQRAIDSVLPSAPSDPDTVTAWLRNHGLEPIPGAGLVLGIVRSGLRSLVPAEESP